MKCNKTINNIKFRFVVINFCAVKWFYHIYTPYSHQGSHTLYLCEKSKQKKLKKLIKNAIVTIV